MEMSGGEGAENYDQMAYTQMQEKKIYDTNQVFVSSKRSFGSHMYQAEDVLQQFGNIELHALGEACTMACEVADKLVVNGAAVITKMTTETVELEGWRHGTLDKKPKLLILLDAVVVS